MDHRRERSRSREHYGSRKVFDRNARDGEDRGGDYRGGDSRGRDRGRDSRDRDRDRYQQRDSSRDRHSSYRERENRDVNIRPAAMHSHPHRAGVPPGVYKGSERVPNSRHSKVPLIDKNDPVVEAVKDDPRVRGAYKLATVTGGGQNTESFDPRSTMCRPEMRVMVGPNRPVLDRRIKHDDVIIVPEFFCELENWDIYYKLIDEMRELQKAESKDAEWIPWAEGSHLIVKDPSASKTFQMVQDRIAAYFKIEQKSIGTRFNMYRYSDDWKPFHHDSAAFNPKRAANQNITVGVSFGSTRELAFLHAQNKSKVYFPQTNGMLFSFGRDVNIVWKHGINALPEDEQDGKGRISIILWGKVPDVIEEENSPKMFSHQPSHRR